jgi:4a-hydroxytetrahydrobiopterin dehydratase
MKPMNDSEIQLELEKIPAWQRKGRAIERVWELADFIAAIAFVNQVAALAESCNHHPDIEILYNRVRIHSWTHDAGGITVRDFQLAAECNKIKV